MSATKPTPVPLAKQFRVGSTVWYKLSSPYCWWPSKVVNVSKDGKRIDLETFGDSYRYTTGTPKYVKPFGGEGDKQLVDKAKSKVGRKKSILQEFNNALDEANEFLQGKSVDSQGHPTANLDDEATSTPATRLPGANPVGRTWTDSVLGGSSICTPNTPSKSVHQMSWMHNLSTPFLKQTEDCIHPGVLCRYESDRKRPQGQKTEEVELEEEEGEEEGRMRSRAKRLKRTRQNKEEKGSSHNGQGRSMTNRTQVENERRVVTPLDYRADSGTSAIPNVLQWSFRPEKPITGYPPRKIKVEGSESTQNKSARKEETARTDGGRDEIPERAAQGELMAATTISDLNSDISNHSLATSYSEDELPPGNLQVNESIDGYLTTTDFKVVRGALHRIRRKWHSLGVELDCSIDELDTIRDEHPGAFDQCLGKMLVLWLRRSRPRPTWEALILALNEPTVGEEALSADIAGKYRN